MRTTVLTALTTLGLASTALVAAPVHASDADSADRAVDYALAQRSDSYRTGGDGPRAYDCSGLTWRSYREAGVRIPRVSDDQYRNGGRTVPMSERQAGDLVFWTENGRASGIYHVGLLVDRNQVVEAASPEQDVHKVHLYERDSMMDHVVRPAAH
ncbi:MAG: C40 family peptidase [Actinomycetes bacterium]